MKRNLQNTKWKLIGTWTVFVTVIATTACAPVRETAAPVSAPTPNTIHATQYNSSTMDKYFPLSAAPQQNTTRKTQKRVRDFVESQQKQR